MKKLVLIRLIDTEIKMQDNGSQAHRSKRYLGHTNKTVLIFVSQIQSVVQHPGHVTLTLSFPGMAIAVVK